MFQLKYKQKMDEELLFWIIGQLHSSKEFFIQKAIGWVLRIRKTSPDVVWEYVQNNELARSVNVKQLSTLNKIME